ncbi:HdeA/HdeB family chaperone [Providencia manganoxydans]|uniref:HdeA/HdeB family chaperone n=1 Tax=Providencia manganoxydans TaxID=2923283 RepID=UPI0034E4038A
MNKALFAGIIAMFLMATSAFATTDTKPVSQWKCEDFLVIDDNFYPTAGRVFNIEIIIIDSVHVQ